MYSQSEIFERFAGIVAKSLHIPVENITMDAHLDDLGAESLDFIEITMESEEQFRISISEKTILQTANEIFGPGVLEADGVLTEKGKSLLRARMPDLDPAMLEGEVLVKDVNKYFLKVSSWVHMIDLLSRHTPQTCTACGGEMEPAVALRVKCKSCGVEAAIPSGEEINRRWVQEFYESTRDSTTATAQA